MTFLMIPVMRIPFLRLTHARPTFLSPVRDDRVAATAAAPSFPIPFRLRRAAAGRKGRLA
jgi:hypothetical protein